jgi:hypothetical protein
MGLLSVYYLSAAYQVFKKLFWYSVFGEEVSSKFSYHAPSPKQEPVMKNANARVRTSMSFYIIILYVCVVRPLLK